MTTNRLLCYEYIARNFSSILERGPVYCNTEFTEVGIEDVLLLQMKTCSPQTDCHTRSTGFAITFYFGISSPLQRGVEHK